MGNINFEDYLSDPATLFRIWLDEAKEKEISNYNAMALSTVTPEGRPAVRMVLLKGLDDRGFVFYTNLESHKGRDLLQTPFAEVCFYWKSLERQVRISGPVEKVSDDESDAYFSSRPRGSRIGAWASRQSRSLQTYDDFYKSVLAMEERFTGQENIPRPPYWSGFRLLPERMEFWIEQPYRLHKRYEFVKKAGKKWSGGWLYP